MVNVMSLTTADTTAPAAPDNSDAAPEPTAKGATTSGAKPTLPVAQGLSWPVDDSITAYLKEQDSIDSQVDVSDLCGVNEALRRVRSRLIETRRLINARARAYQDAETAYQQALRRARLTVDGRTAAEREALAEVMCEQKESTMRVSKALLDEATGLQRVLRMELDGLEALSNNLRAEMKL